MKKTREQAILLYTFCLLLTALLVTVIAVCLSGNRQSAKSMEEVSDPVVAAFQGGRVKEGNGPILKKYYGLNPEDYEDVVLYVPLTNMDAEELLIIRLADTSQSEAVEEAIRSRQESQIGIYENYAPEQLALCEQAVIDACGNYILYVVHENAPEIDAVFRDSL